MQTWPYLGKPQKVRFPDAHSPPKAVGPNPSLLDPFSDRLNGKLCHFRYSLNFQESRFWLFTIHTHNDLALSG